MKSNLLIILAKFFIGYLIGYFCFSYLEYIELFCIYVFENKIYIFFYILLVDLFYKIIKGLS